MKRFPKMINLVLLGLVLLGLVSCTRSDREERVELIRAKHGAEALGPVVEVVELSVGAQLYRDKTCNTCHGDNGVMALLPNYPVLARQGEEYALQQMMDIQSGARANGQSAAMKAVVQGITEEEFAVLATYIANELGEGVAIGAEHVDEESVGAQLFRSKTCTACHGKDGKTPILPTYPRIAGHSREYILQQMTDVKSGARANSMAVLGMQGIMHLVTEEEMGHLADYVSSLPR